MVAKEGVEVSEEQNRLRNLLSMSVNEIELSVRAANCLNNANITTVGELATKSEPEMLKYRNFGKKSLNEIKAKLLSENGFGEVDVEVVNGLVLLSGRVSSPEMRVRAEDIAWSSKLTRDVANEIQIERPGGFFANVNDEVITARVRTALMTSATVKSLNFNIETYNGVVYLMGLARSEEELETAAQRASVVQGVERVVSYVRVREPHQRQAAPAGNTGGGSDEELLGGNVY